MYIYSYVHMYVYYVAKPRSSRHVATFWPQHMLWELWHRMPFVAPMHHMQSALISSSDAMGGKTFRSKTLGDDDLDGFFSLSQWLQRVGSLSVWSCQKCKTLAARNSWLETSFFFKGTLEIKSGGNWFLGNAIVWATTVVAEVLFDFPNRFGRRGYNFSPRRNSGCGPISDAGGQKKRNGMQWRGKE